MITNQKVTNNESMKDDAQLDQASITCYADLHTRFLMTKRYRLPPTFVIVQNTNGSDHEVGHLLLHGVVNL